jgi:lipopolysaccharide/colanic/teichoic acid biosynthesis glycosyltransferase
MHELSNAVISSGNSGKMVPLLACLWEWLLNRNEIDFDRWMRMDLEYIYSWSLWLDFKILLRTVGCVFRGDGR